MSKRVVLAALIALASLAHADERLSDRGLGIGEAIAEREAAQHGSSVLPSGAGLPEGRGRADEGRTIYLAKCASCHGDEGEGRPGYLPLVGGQGSLTSGKPRFTVGSYWPTATTLFDYLWRAMPYEAPGSLSANEVYALTAWILSANKITASRQIMDRAALLKVKMPNANGFERPISPRHLTRGTPESVGVSSERLREATALLERFVGNRRPRARWPRSRGEARSCICNRSACRISRRRHR